MPGYPWLKMPCLPKPEYLLMRALQKEYNLDSLTELFAVSLRLLHEVSQMERAQITDGDSYVKLIVDAYRSTPEHRRIYERGV